jgi:predicted Zn-dependent protease
MQQPPNVAMAPAATEVGLEALIAQVKDGILIREGTVQTDFQARTGEIWGNEKNGGGLFEIKNGKVTKMLEGGIVQFDALDLWRHVTAVGGASTQAVIPVDYGKWYNVLYMRMTGEYPVKGEPPQFTSYSVQAPAAVISNQAVIDPRRKA